MRKTLLFALLALFSLLLASFSVSAYHLNDDSYKSTYRYSQTTSMQGCDSSTKTVESRRTVQTVVDYYGTERRVSSDRIVREDRNPCEYARYYGRSCDYYADTCAGYPSTHYRYRGMYQPRQYVEVYAQPYYYRPSIDSSGAYDWRY
ncbi:hypothetical protein HYZ97_01410 [Candidatus Pacearchaeota archaeon]|nr:hypothetical protein [Candidatus Pacearchaeota archaeon]